MRRKVKDLISFEALRHLVYVPVIILRIKNWYSFLLNYIGFRNEANTYELRNGLKIKTEGGIDTATIAVIFVKKDYGDIGNNCTVIDVGANIGIFSVFAASKSRSVKVYAYEPMPKSYELLIENSKINKLENNIFPFKNGIAASRGKRKLFLASGSPFHSLYLSKNEKHLEIDCLSLKDVFDENGIDRCDVLKMDCEGAEFEILYNTPKDIFSKIKEIRLEYHNQKKENCNAQDLIGFLEKNGFELFHFKEDNKQSGNAWLRAS